ncbi:uncharacterized protein [Panulirus ornatus]|uniref:uncharacterized protein n=1 Tax=Panulirus ornatus TaxID=150431 RepID=UPI003A84F79C
MDVDTDAGDASKEALEFSGTHYDASCPSVDEEKTSEDQCCVQGSEDGQNQRISSEVTAEAGSHSPPPNSESLPNLEDAEEAKVLDTAPPNDADDTQEANITSAKSVETRNSKNEIVPCSNYEFSEMTFPAMINLDDLEEQEAIENFSDEDLVSDADFEAFSETEHDTDMDNLNFELFEPHIKGDKIDGKMLSKRQKKLRKLRRKFSFSSSEKQPKDIKGTITSSLKRFKNAKDKIEKLMHRTLRSDTAPSHSSGESLEGSAPASQSSGHHTAHTSRSSPRTRGPLERSDSHSSKTSESQVSASLDRTECRTSDHSGSVGGVSRNTSKSSDDRSSVGPWDVRPHDGDESTYSWSDADSDFEYVPMEPCKTMVMCKEMCDNSNNESVEACKGPHSPQPRPAVERPTQSLTQDVSSTPGNEGL